MICNNFRNRAHYDFFKNSQIIVISILNSICVLLFINSLEAYII